MSVTIEAGRFRELQARCRRLRVTLDRAQKELALLSTREGELEGCYELEQELENARKDYDQAAKGWAKGSVTRDEVRETLLVPTLA